MFIDSQFQSEYVIYQTKGGAAFKTIVIQVNSGFENRNSVWEYPLAKFDFGDRKLPDVEMTEIINWFYAMYGMANGFRLKDHGDYIVTTANGTLNALTANVPAETLVVGSAYQIISVGTTDFTTAGAESNTPGSTFTATGTATGTGVCAFLYGQLGSVGTGLGYPTYQCVKSYTTGGSIGQRLITKLVAGTAAMYRNGTPLVIGASAGNIAVNDNTGVVTFVADAHASATAITAGTTTQVTLASNPKSLVVGEYLYLAGFTDPHGVINGQSAMITNIASDVFTLAINTTDQYSATPTPPTLGSGVGYAYPQPDDVLTFAAQFDIPVRFDTDELKYTFIGAEILTPGVTGVEYFYLDPLPIIEVRDIV